LRGANETDSQLRGDADPTLPPHIPVENEGKHGGGHEPDEDETNTPRRRCSEYRANRPAVSQRSHLEPVQNESVDENESRFDLVSDMGAIT
jgi:hypothetical protein